MLGSVAVLAIYYWVLLAQPGAASDVADPQLRRAMADSLSAFASGDHAGALASTEYLVAELPSQPVFADRLAQIYQHLDRPADEALAWEQLMRVSPTPSDGCPMVGQAYRRAGRAEQALSAFERCVALSPKDPDSRLFLGQAYASAGRSADGRREFEAGLALEPSYPDLHLVLGIRDFADGRFPDALGHFDRFLELAPDRRQEVAVWLERTEQFR